MLKNISGTKGTRENVKKIGGIFGSTGSPRDSK